MTRLRTVLATIALAIATPAMASAPVERIYATQSGKPAYDADPYGGNPFATALIATLAPDIEDAADSLFEETLYNSGNLQIADPDAMGQGASLLPGDSENATALVLVFADYGNDENGLASLPGAAFDAVRVARALEIAGYDVTMTVASDADQYRASLRQFATVSEGADRALLYTTAHGGEREGTIYLVPPEGELLSDIFRGAIMLDEVASALRARFSNRLFYAGCRDDPSDLR